MNGPHGYEQNTEMLEEKNICKNRAYQNRIPMVLMLLTMLILTIESLTAPAALLSLLPGQTMRLPHYNMRKTNHKEFIRPINPELFSLWSEIH